jgi:hypothetical protein
MPPKFPMWWHGLDTTSSARWWTLTAGGRVQRALTGSVHTADEAGEGWTRLKHKGIGRFTRRRIASMSNPFHLLFRAEICKYQLFRRMCINNAT